MEMAINEGWTPLSASSLVESQRLVIDKKIPTIPSGGGVVLKW